MCAVCGRSFDSRKQLEQHTQYAHKSGMMKPVKKSFKLSKKLIAIIGVIAIYAAMAPHVSFPAVRATDGIHVIRWNNLPFTYIHT